MSKPKTKKIAFAGGGIIPKSISLTGKDQVVAAHAPVAVPVEYAEHLIHERVAYDPDGNDAPSKPAKTNQSADKADDIVAAAEDKAKGLIDAAETKAREITEAAEAKAGETVKAADTKASDTVTTAETRAKEITDAAEVQAADIVKAAEEKAKSAGQRDS
jgi:vacuolar-type H+-ATPase subunit H